MNDVVDLAAFRASRAAKPTTEVVEQRMTLRINERDLIEIDHPELAHLIFFDADEAIAFGRAMVHLGGLIRSALHSRDPEVIAAREADRAKRVERSKVALVGKDGRKLPPLKIAGWAVETFGGHTGADAPPLWVRMTAPRRTELGARSLIESYLQHGYAREHIRVVPVDHRGRAIPSERMPTEPTP